MSSKAKFEDYVMNMDPQDREFGFKFAKHLRFVFYNSGDEFLYNMVQALRFLNTKKETIAYTDREKYIYLNAPKGASIGKVYDKWKFIYIHECLHQIWDTFGVEDKIKKDKGSCNHGLMNIASDCVINDFIYNYFNLDYPTDGLVTPEAIKEDFGVEYDRKEDNQYSLYMKLEPHLKKAERLPKYKKEFEEAEAPQVNIKPQGGGQQGKTNLIPTSQQYKNGHEKAVYVINRILKEQYQKYDANSGEIPKVIDALTAALNEIVKLSGKSKSYTFESQIVFEEVDDRFKTFEQGWEAALAESTNTIQDTIQQLGDAMINPKGGSGGSAPINLPPPDQDVPDFNETEENLFLPKTLGSFSQPQGEGGGESGEGGDGSSDEDIDNMDGDDAAQDAQDSANRAQRAADKAQEKADSTGNSADQKAADKAQKAANKSKRAASKAQKAADKGDSKGAQNAAKEARDAANEAEASAGSNEKGNQKANMPDDKELGNDPAKGGNQPKKPKPGYQAHDDSAWSDEAGGGFVDALHEFQEDLDEDEMVPEEIINRYKKKISGTLGDFIKKCGKARMQGMGAPAYSPLGKERRNWQAEFMTNAVNIMRSGIARMEKEYRKTYSRPNRRNGIVKPGQMLKKGRVEIKEGTTITMKFFVDRSGSMNDWGVRKVLEAVWAFCDKIKAQYKNNKMIKQFDCLVYPFDTDIHEPLKYGAICSSGGCNCKFSDLLNAMQKVNENTMLNVIITDAQWPVNVSQSLSKLKDIDGKVLMITNENDGEESVEACRRIEQGCNKFQLILADKEWTLK